MAIERDRAEQLRKHAQAQEDAAMELARSAVTLWRARLDMALDLGDPEAVRGMMGDIGPVAWNDNNCQCSRGTVA